jgi:hypothetical protein
MSFAPTSHPRALWLVVVEANAHNVGFDHVDPKLHRSLVSQAAVENQSLVGVLVANPTADEALIDADLFVVEWSGDGIPINGLVHIKSLVLS